MVDLVWNAILASMSQKDPPQEQVAEATAAVIEAEQTNNDAVDTLDIEATVLKQLQSDLHSEGSKDATASASLPSSDDAVPAP